MADRIDPRNVMRERNRLNSIQEQCLRRAMSGFAVQPGDINKIIDHAKAMIEATKILMPQEPNEILLERLYALAIDPDLLALLERIIDRLPAPLDW